MGTHEQNQTDVAERGAGAGESRASGYWANSAARRRQKTAELERRRREVLLKKQARRRRWKSRPLYQRLMVYGTIVAVPIVANAVQAGGSDAPSDDVLLARVDSSRLVLEQLATVSADSDIAAALTPDDTTRIQKTGSFDMIRKASHTAFIIDLNGRMRTAIDAAAEFSVGGDVISLSPTEAYYTLSLWQQDSTRAPGGRPWVKLSVDQLHQQAEERGVVLDTSLPPGVLTLIDRSSSADRAADRDADIPDTEAIEVRADGSRIVAESLIPTSVRRLIEQALRGVVLDDDAYTEHTIGFTIWIDDTNSPHALHFDATSYVRNVLIDAAELDGVDQAALLELAGNLTVTGKFQFYGFNEPKAIGGPTGEQFTVLGG